MTGPKGRDPVPRLLEVLCPLGVVLVALVVRLLLARSGFSDGILPVGPDADDWLHGVMALGRDDPTALQAHRYPLVPLLASWLWRLGLGSPVAMLWSLSLASGAAAAGLCWAVARRFLGPGRALAPALTIALCPSLVLLSNQTIAYGPAALFFLALVWSLLTERRWAGPLVAGLAAVALVSSLNQGLLELIAVLPAALLLRRWRVLGAFVVGGVLGLGLVHLIHAQAHDPVVWMLTELERYLSGNVAEETSMAGLSYSRAWAAWAHRAFDLRAVFLLVYFAIGVCGLAFGRPSWKLRAALAWLAAPVLVLAPLMASRHHLSHLLPLLAVALFVGVDRLLPRRMGLIAGFVVLGALCVEARQRVQPVLGQLEGGVREAQQQILLGEAVVGMLPEGGLMLYLDPRERERMHVIETALWTFPGNIEVVRVVPEEPSHAVRSLSRAFDAGRPVVLVAPPDSPPPWRVGSYQLEGVEPPVQVEFAVARTKRSLWTVEAASAGSHP